MKRKLSNRALVYLASQIVADLLNNVSPDALMNSIVEGDCIPTIDNMDAMCGAARQAITMMAMDQQLKDDNGSGVVADAIQEARIAIDCMENMFQDYGQCFNDLELLLFNKEGSPCDEEIKEIETVLEFIGFPSGTE